MPLHHLRVSDSASGGSDQTAPFVSGGPPSVAIPPDLANRAAVSDNINRHNFLEPIHAFRESDLPGDEGYATMDENGNIVINRSGDQPDDFDEVSVRSELEAILGGQAEPQEAVAAPATDVQTTPASQPTIEEDGAPNLVQKLLNEPALLNTVLRAVGTLAGSGSSAASFNAAGLDPEHVIALVNSGRQQEAVVESQRLREDELSIDAHFKKIQTEIAAYNSETNRRSVESLEHARELTQQYNNDKLALEQLKARSSGMQLTPIQKVESQILVDRLKKENSTQQKLREKKLGLRDEFIPPGQRAFDTAVGREEAQQLFPDEEEIFSIKDVQAAFKEAERMALGPLGSSLGADPVLHGKEFVRLIQGMPLDEAGRNRAVALSESLVDKAADNSSQQLQSPGAAPQAPPASAVQAPAPAGTRLIIGGSGQVTPR